jgi:nitrate reductase NapAB chaperone NapD
VHYSGILVITDPGRLSDCALQVEKLAGVEVRHRYPDDDRMILIQESASVEEQEHGLSEIRAIAGVQLADLVYHHVSDGVET